MAELARLAGAEAGVVIYAVNRSQDDPVAFVLYELYRDRAAWEAHLTIDTVQRALQQFDRLLAAPPASSAAIAWRWLESAKCQPPGGQENSRNPPAALYHSGSISPLQEAS